MRRREDPRATAAIVQSMFPGEETGTYQLRPEFAAIRASVPAHAYPHASARLFYELNRRRRPAYAIT